MVLVLPAIKKKPSFSQSLGASFSEGLSKGIGSGIEHALKSGLERAKNKGKIPSNIAKATASFLKLHDPNGSIQNTNKTFEFQELANQFAEQGFSEEDAMKAAFLHLTNPINEENYNGEEPSFSDKVNPNDKRSFLDKILSPASEEQYRKESDEDIEDIKTGILKGIRPFIKYGPEFLQESLGLNSNKSSPVTGLAPNFQKQEERKNPSPLEAFDEATGGKAKPSNLIERSIEGFPLGGAGIAGSATQEALKGLGAPESVQHAGNIIAMILSGQIPKLANIGQKAIGVAKKTGQTAEEVLLKAQKESGVDLQKVAAGDEKAISSLSKKITEPPEISGKVKETPKSVYNKEAAAKEREVFGEKLSESPLEDYYEIKNKEKAKEAAKRPTTLAKEEEFRQSLRPLEKDLFKELRAEKEALRDIKKERIRSPKSESPKFDQLESQKTSKIEEINERLKDVQYGLKHAKPRPTDAQIEAQVSKHLEDLTEHVKNPTPESKIKAESGIQSDRKALESAKKILDRGELPGEIRPDTFIRIQRKYLEGYNQAITKQQELIDALSTKLRKTPSDKYVLNEAKDLMDLFKRRAKVLESKIIKQTDNIKSLGALEKPSGAFYKNQIKSVRKDLEDFNHDLFKKRRVLNQEDFKSRVVARKNIPSEKIEKIGRDAIKEDAKLSIEKLSEESGIPKQKAEKIVEKFKSEGKKVSGKIEKGTLKPKDEKNWADEVKKYVAVTLGSYAGYEAIGFGVGATQALFEEYLGWKPSASLLKSIVGKRGAGGRPSFGYDTVMGWFDEAQANELRKRRDNPKEYNKYINLMRLNHGDKKVRRVQKILKEQEQERQATKTH